MEPASDKNLRAHSAILLSSILVVSCAANPAGSGSASSVAVAAQNSLEASLQNVHVRFLYSDYYSLNSPNLSGCAGDAKTYYDAIAASSSLAPTALQTNVINTAETIRPSFIKNISVDVTDANSNVPSNHAFSCSYGVGSSAPPATNCATFDYGADNGISANFAGSIFLVGGIATPSGQDLTASCSPSNSFSTDSCLTSIYAFNLNSFPASSATNPPNSLVPGLTQATQPISSWANLNSSTSYAGPLGIAGSSITYDGGTKQVAIFGGSTIQATTNGSTTTEAAPTDTTYTFNAQTQAWTNLLSSPNVNIALKQVPEQDPSGDFTLSKPASGRANFGYIALSGVSLTGMSTNGTVAGGNVDHTDHIIIVGGQDSAGYEADTHKFNPTFAPEWVDALKSTGAGIAVPAGGIAQYLDNYEVQIMHNENAASLMEPIYPAATPTPVAGTAFGMAPIYNNSSTVPNTSVNTGYGLVMGGLDPRATTAGTATESCNGTACALLRSSRFNADESSTANFLSLGNLPYSVGGTTEFKPVQWQSYTAASGVPWYGGSSLLPGFSLLNNDVVFFGGSNCLNYQVVGQTGCLFNNPGKYFRMTTNPAASLTVPANVAFSGVGAPPVAGMAAARGLDQVGGNPLIVAFGGMIGLGAMADTSIYYLFNNGSVASPAPKWVKVSTPLGGPTVVSNGSMVYSHVTGKFYLFGGFNSGTGGYSGDTWELSVSGAGCAASGSATPCQFSWRQLNVVNGLSCFPTTCPIGRRSHRMVEVNYNNLTPWQEPSCSAGTPCSFGIFMEGGTPDGSTLLSDRWMFDPTANDGNGLWQQMNEMPARTQAPMAAVDYTDLKTSLPHHMAVLFGGETGLQNPSNAALPNSFLPPTLGDTWIYDFDNSSWNRVNLLGTGYNGLGSAAFTTEIQRRQAYEASAPSPATISDLTPPPISGGIMVTRTFPNTTTTGQIPEVYLIGGRKKDGTYQPFTNIYKFCIASTGESFASGSLVPGSGCDSYDPVLNPNSLSPISLGSNGYTGRWLRKAPATVVDPVTGGVPSAFLGAGTYDPVDDKILVYGGLQAASSGAFVTNGTTISSSVFEYTPPSTVSPEGAWTEALACPGTSPPTGRYGHSLNYDARNQALVSIGGFDVNGAPLTANINQAGSANYSVPEVWQAVRSLAGPGGTPCYTWTEITTFSNSTADATQVPPALGFGFGAGIYIPSDSYNTGFYSTFDASCAGSGPISTQGDGPNGLLAGGAYIDVDRTQLGTYENLILNLTFIPLNQNNLAANGTQFTASDNAVFKIHLVSTGQTADALQGVLQPRFLTYTDNPSYPEVVQSLSVMAPPNGQIQQQQLLIPLASDPTIDRIRIERVSGTAILLDASIFRMGPGAGQ